MRSAVPKVLHEIAGRPMLGHVHCRFIGSRCIPLCLVTAPDQQEVRDYALTQVPEISNCIQENQLGTGDAVRAAMSAGRGGAGGDYVWRHTAYAARYASSTCDVEADVALGFEPKTQPPTDASLWKQTRLRASSNIKMERRHAP